MLQINMNKISSLKNLWIVLWSGSAAVVTTLIVGFIIAFPCLYNAFKKKKKAPGHRILLREHSYDN